MKSLTELKGLSKDGLVAIIGDRSLADGERCAALCVMQRRFGQEAVDSLVPSPDGEFNSTIYQYKFNQFYKINI